jgi:hypothetical protein
MANSCLNEIVKKNDQEKTLLESDITSNKDLKEKNFKTTNINILLNRVRLDKKKIFVKRLTFFVLFTLITSASIYFLFN